MWCSPEFVAVAEVAVEASRLTDSDVGLTGRADLLPLVEGSHKHLHNFATSSVIQHVTKVQSGSAGTRKTEVNAMTTDNSYQSYIG